MAQQEQKLFLEKESSNEVFVKLAGLPDPIETRKYILLHFTFQIEFRIFILIV